MLTANVLCLKKRRKRKGEYILNLPSTILVNHGNTKTRKVGNMLHITEDTPADMLSGAMDLTVHLPTGKTVKMCVERRTPMMDLLVQVTTNHHLQITNYTLQPLQTSSTSGDDGAPERALSYYPNTPIGALDTQRIRVIPKTRTLPIAKNAPPAQQQPFETTFRLKVHLPRNQLYVTRVSKHVHIGDIMRKVCEEKSLDPNKYEVRHPGNLDEILDPKLTLNDYMITEINLVVKGSNTSVQTFTSDDIMTLRKDEKKAPPTKSGGVFNLLFRRGKTNNVTPPPPIKETNINVRNEEPAKQPVVVQEVQREKPKIPQRKRRPAPKPPQPPQVQKDAADEPVQLRNGSVISDASNASEKDAITVCHSRHSSDSSGYHETSILSDHHCNASLPRRNGGPTKLNRYSESTGNLTKMTSHSRSTSSLIFPGRKKKAAPAPPPSNHQSSSTHLERFSPVVASQIPSSASSSKTDLSLASQGTQKNTNPPPIPRRRKGPAPQQNGMKPVSSSLENEDDEDSLYSCPYQTEGGVHVVKETPETSRPPSNMSTIDILKSLEYLNLDDQGNEIKPPEIIAVLPKTNEDSALPKRPFLLNLVDKELDDDNMESPVRHEFNSIVSDASSVEAPPRRARLFEESSLKSSESAVFEEGLMKRWGSWEKLDVSNTPSPMEETNGLSSVEGPEDDVNSSSRYLDTETNERPEEIKERVSGEGILFLTDADISSTSSHHSGGKLSVTVEKSQKEFATEISLDDVERYKNYGNSPDSGNSSEISEKSKIDDELASMDVSTADQGVVIEEWQLPSPPKAFKDDTDSVITPELIEKLERIEKERRTDEEDDSILSKLSLENLEKRKSLVYNRELATSLKMSYESAVAKNDSSEQKTTEKPEMEKKEVNKHSTLPNFKITTYEEPKQVKVFEDDTVRSNSDFPGKSLSLNRGETPNKKESDRRTFLPFRRQVNRSGSFSADQDVWVSSKPVARSKSQVALRRGDARNGVFEKGVMSKSSSLFDVSGLQSLEVMKKIQNKLNTPTASMETLSKIDQKKEIESKPKNVEVEELPRKKYQYTGPPSVNMGTWSERPKVPVSVKEDADYKLGLGTNKRFLQNGSSANYVNSKPNEQKVTITTSNGISESHYSKIKIEEQMRQNRNSLNRTTQRPHSVAFSSDFDISRVPVVRSVELKKNVNTSITQLNQSNDGFYRNGYFEKNKNCENTNERDVTKPVLRAKSFLQSVPVVRGFRTLENRTNVENSNRYSWQTAPSMTLPNATKREVFATNSNVPFSRFNLKRTDSKSSKDDLVNNNLQSVEYEIPKPPPAMPKMVEKKISKRQFVPVLDPRDELLKSIRDFGGKKGLKRRGEA